MRRWRVPAAGAVAAVVLIAAYGIWFHQPRKAEIGTLLAETKQLRAAQNPLRRDIEGLEEVAARQPEFDAALRSLEHLIPSELAQPSILAELQAAAKETGVELLSVTFGDPDVPKGAPESHVPGTVLAAMPITVIVEGPFLAITDLLRQVETDIDRAVLVGTVALTEAEASFPQLTGTWSGQAYALLPADDPLLADPDVAPPADPAPTAPSTEGP